MIFYFYVFFIYKVPRFIEKAQIIAGQNAFWGRGQCVCVCGGGGDLANLKKYAKNKDYVWFKNVFIAILIEK